MATMSAGMSRAGVVAGRTLAAAISEDQPSRRLMVSAVTLESLGMGIPRSADPDDGCGAIPPLRFVIVEGKKDAGLHWAVVG